MERPEDYAGLGVLLVALGALFLLQNFGFLGDIGNLIWVSLFGLGGLAFLWVFIANREQWWALIPGFALLGLAGTLFLSDLDIAGGLIGGFFLGSIGMAFLIIYIIRREHWWAIIPAGALLTLALVATVSSSLPGEVGGSIFFFGLAATFGAHLLPTDGSAVVTDRRASWRSLACSFSPRARHTRPGDPIRPDGLGRHHRLARHRNGNRLKSRRDIE
jgi:hypothetical protein